MKGNDRTVKQIRHTAHAEGCHDVLRAFLDLADRDPFHAVEWAQRMYRDPQEFDDFIRDAQDRRELAR